MAKERKNPPPVEQEKPKTDPASQKGRKHRATFARDKRNGGYMVRVEGPFANQFSGQEVPVLLKDGTEHVEKLIAVVWSGLDQESGKPVALYSFLARPRNVEKVEF